jgi:uncharacterized DUF497 family protein
MQFEFDPAKSASNKIKHGLDFVEAQAIWKGWTIEIPAKNVEGENRYAVLGEISGRAHTAIITYRGGTVRIISVRQSNPTEKAYYEHNKPKPR